MKISTVLDKIDSGAIALPEFQRGYVWSRRQVRDLVESLYRRFPVGSLLLWETATESADTRGEGELQRGIEDFAILALDGRSEEAVLDVAWPDGLTHGEERVALLLNEPPEVVEAAGRHGYRFFTSVPALQAHAQRYLADAAA